MTGGIIVRGGEAFSQFGKSAVTPTHLKKILKKCHKADGESVTDLIHPTPLSLLTFDMVFQPHRWSKYASEFLKYVKDLKLIMKMYCIIDIFNCFDFKIKTEKDYKDCLKKAEYLFSKARFNTRFERIADIFEYVVKVNLVLGTCPLKGFKELKSASVYKFDTLETYLSLFETGLKNVNFLTIDEIIKNVVITNRNGQIKLSTLFDNDDLFSLTFEKNIGMCSYILKTNIPTMMSMIQHELHLLFADSESRKHVIENLKKSIVVVNNEISKEVETMFSLIEKRNDKEIDFLNKYVDKDSSTLAKIIERKEKIVSDIDEAKKKIETEENASVADKIRQLDLELKGAMKIESIILQEKNRKQYISSNQPLPISSSVPFGSFLPGSKKHKESVKEQKKNIHEEKLQKKLTLAEKTIQLNELKIAALSKQYVEATTEIYGQKQTIETLKKGLSSSEKKGDILKNHISKVETANKKLQEEIDRSADIFKKITERLQLSQKQYKDLMTFCNNIQDRSNLTQDEKNNKIYKAFLNLLGSYGTRENENFDEKTSFAFDQILSSLCCRPIPIFSNSTSKTDLDHYSELLPFDWMKDREVGDKLVFKQQGEGMVNYYQDSNCKHVDTSEDLIIVDLNPVEKKSIEKLEKYLSSHNLLPSRPVFEKKFMSIKYKSIGDVEKHIGTKLKTTWEGLNNSVFSLSREIFTTVGQPIGTKITTETIQKYVFPFLNIFLGLDSFDLPVISKIIEIYYFEDTGSKLFNNLFSAVYECPANI